MKYLIKQGRVGESRYKIYVLKESLGKIEGFYQSCFCEGFPRPSQMSPKQGRVGEIRYGRYVLKEHLADDCISHNAWRARDIEADRDVLLMVPKRRSSQTATEAAIARQLKDVGVLPLFDMIESADGVVGVYQYPVGGNLQMFLDLFGGMQEAEAQILMYDLLKAVCAAHELGIVHRDITPKNILLTRHGIARDRVRLGDLGFAATTVNRPIQGRPVASLRYAAPELWNGMDYDEKIDVWALGMILFLCLMGRRPKTRENFDDLAELGFGISGRAGPLSREAVDLMKKLLDPDPQNRISAIEALCDPWFSIHTEEIEEKTAQHLEPWYRI